MKKLIIYLSLVLLVVGCGINGDLVEDDSLEKLVRVEVGQTNGKLAEEDLEEIKTLKLKQGDLAGEEDIKSIAGIEKLTNLKGLNLRGQQIEDLSPLEELSGIKYLDLANNKITSLEILTKLDKLIYLDISNNNLDISDESNSMQIIKDLRDRGVTVKY